jgi:BirA family biotin operon repressor/biotin-[acetyl-CoA-carboxylase] ligase
MTNRKKQSARKTADGPDSTDQRIDRLLTLLLEHPMIFLSGAKIAKEIGVGRSSVWHWVERLRALGVKVKSHPGAGYMLERTPDVLTPSMLRARLRATPFGKKIHHFFRIGSTNDHAMELAAAGEPHGTLVVAEEQTAGRGRLDRRWQSPKSTSISVSFILRPPLSPAEAPLLTLAAGLAVHDAVREVTEFTADLRWPNDLLLDSKKFCGILTEMQAEARNIRHVVVGIGLNVNQTKFAPDLEKIATSLALVGGKTYYRLDLLGRLLTAFDGYYNQLLREGSRPLVEAFKKTSSYARGKRIRVIGAREEYTGTTAGLDHAGCLLVRREDTGKTVAVLAGDVREA